MRPVAVAREVPLTALGAWRNFAAFPILPDEIGGTPEARSFSHGKG
jgi:hypothetical protein